VRGRVGWRLYTDSTWSANGAFGSFVDDARARRRAATRANATMESYRKAFIQTGKFAPMKHFMVRGDGQGLRWRARAFEVCARMRDEGDCVVRARARRRRAMTRGADG